MLRHTKTVAQRGKSCVSKALASKSGRNFSSISSNNVPSSQVASSFLNGSSSAYLEEMYWLWKQNPNAVHKSWDVYFRTGNYTAPPSLVAEYSQNPEAANVNVAPMPVQQGGLSLDAARVVQLIRAFQVRGHLVANIDPLGIMPPRPEAEDLTLQHYGFTDADLDRVIDLTGLSADIKGFLDKGRQPTTLCNIHKRLQETYCSTVGFEYMHIPSVEKCNWIREKIETIQQLEFTPEQKLKILDRLTWADHFEQFLAKKFTSTKRFGLEGAESTIAGMKHLIGRSAELGVEAIVMGMPHRGRLNVLGNVVRKPFEQIFCEFQGHKPEDEDCGSGDVKYHLGFSVNRPSGAEKKMLHVTLLANPSHLEAVNPVVAGKTKAKQDFYYDADKSKVMGVLLHGDAAFAGQGIVYETMALADLKNYSTGGTIHIVVNNQIGFTTDPTDSRGTPYCTDIAKAFNAPVFHVNGDDPEAVVRVFTLAAEWRAHFKTDIVIDIVSYRKFGHNEIDEPAFTQPHMYKNIRSRKSTLQLYQEKLSSEKSLTTQQIDEVSNKVNGILEKAFDSSKTYHFKAGDWLQSGTAWEGLKAWNQYSEPKPTGVDKEILRKIGVASATYPEDFTPHPRIKTVLDKKLETMKTGKGIDWGTAEALAFGSVLLDKKPVRISGQDVQRGTFSHRHALLHDQKIANRQYVPLSHLSPDQGKLTLSNSNLSEFGVLGFELGYSLENPHQLVLWEAQFGDFFNGAQIMVDQFISSMEEKWFRQTGLVMLLPHGYEGQGPEHSSARLERFLQQSNDHPDKIPDPSKSLQIQAANWQVVNCSTPANYFHVLRRQLYRDFRKPLVVMSPKSLLRLPAAASTLEDMSTNTQFQSVIGDVDPKLVQADKVRRVVFCTGKVYYDLAEARNHKKAHDVAIVRVEQISPFPFYRVAEEAMKYPNADFVWAQEEPMNMGSWTYVAPRFNTTFKQLVKRDVAFTYAGRAPAASPAVGYHHTHQVEQAALVKDALGL